jgi:hypothetical protein
MEGRKVGRMMEDGRKEDGGRKEDAGRNMKQRQEGTKTQPP